MERPACAIWDAVSGPGTCALVLVPRAKLCVQLKLTCAERQENTPTHPPPSIIRVDACQSATPPSRIGT